MESRAEPAAGFDLTIRADTQGSLAKANQDLLAAAT